MKLFTLLLAQLLTSAVALAEPSTQPAPKATTTTRPTKQLYFDVGFYQPTWRARLPPGFLPAVVEAGGRFLANNGKEDSYFAGGYKGPNEDIIPAKLRYAVAGLPPGTLYVFDQERPTWGTDPRINPPAVVEANKRRFRAFAATIHEERPMVRVAFYGMLPVGEYWVYTRQWAARKCFEKWQAGGELTNDEKWAIGKAYSWDGSAYKLNDQISDWEGRAAFLKSQAANTSDTFGTRDDGTIDEAAGLDDAVDAITPSLYDFYPGDESEGYVTLTIAESRRIAGGRPIYPFVWPVWHDSNKTDGGKTIPIDEWRLHVRRILRQADGCVLWGSDPVRHREHIRVLLEEAEAASRDAGGK